MVTLYQDLPMSTKVTANTPDDVILFQFFGIPINTIFCDTTSISQFLIGNIRVPSHQSNDFLRSFLRSFSTCLRSSLRSCLRSTYRSCFRSNRAVFFIISRNWLAITSSMNRDMNQEGQAVFGSLKGVNVVGKRTDTVIDVTSSTLQA